MLPNFNDWVDSKIAERVALDARAGLTELEPPAHALPRLRRPMRAADGELLGFDSMPLADAIGDGETTRADRDTRAICVDTPSTEGLTA